jgi:hypothetical protein
MFLSVIVYEEEKPCMPEYEVPFPPVDIEHGHGRPPEYSVSKDIW